MHQQHEDCIKACQACVSECEHCATTCSKKTNVKIYLIALPLIATVQLFAHWLLK